MLRQKFGNTCCWVFFNWLTHRTRPPHRNSNTRQPQSIMYVFGSMVSGRTGSKLLSMIHRCQWAVGARFLLPVRFKSACTRTHTTGCCTGNQRPTQIWRMYALRLDICFGFRCGSAHFMCWWESHSFLVNMYVSPSRPPFLPPACFCTCWRIYSVCVMFGVRRSWSLC